ncbi:phage portal protein [Escherichia albertii]|nr:phage portal protein [Escherichia albertii]EFJ2285698.1 phage portal protein [Escherichia albertii]EFO0110419.1 phage portal protein [Escherichia albertii]MLY52165.1 phage portal protein [Escherichia albertii]
MFNFNFRKEKEQPKEEPKLYIGKAKIRTEPVLGNLGIETKCSISSIGNGNAAAQLGTFGAVGKSGSINAVINRVLNTAVLQSRQLSMSNPIHKKYIAQNASSVCGANGITYRPCVHVAEDDNVNNDINKRLADAFYSWCEDPARFSLNGKLEMSKFQSLVEKTRSIDGSCFIRIHPGMKIEVLDSTVIDTKGNQWLSNGNYRSNGIEFEKGTGKPVAYFLTQYDPVSYSVSTEAERVPAEEILHLFSTDYPEQQRGIPDIFCGTGLLADLDKFMRASIKTRQLAAESMGFITNASRDASFEDIDDDDDSDVDEYQVARMEGGVLLELREGQDVKSLSPSQTFDALQEFLDNQLIFIGMSLDLTPQTLTGSTAGASFSASKLTDKIQQNTFLAKQNNLVKSVLQPLYIKWLKNEMLNNPMLKDLPFSKFTELTECNFIPQRHISLDPLKDLQTEILAMENGLKSKEQIISEMGYSPVLTHEQITKEETDGTKQPDEGDSSTDNQ